MQNRFRHIVIIGASLLLSTTGCPLKATINQTTDTTSNVTGTTSGAAWWNEDGQLKPDFKATAFVSFNYDNLQRDLAAGRGEYLASLSRLLGVPTEREPAFFSKAQSNYATIGDKGPTALLTQLRDTSKAFIR